MRLPSGADISRVKLLRAGRDVPFSKAGQLVEFVIPNVIDYEVAALV